MSLYFLQLLARTVLWSCDNYRKLNDAQYTNLAFQHMIHDICILVRPQRSLPIATTLTLTVYPAHNPNRSRCRVVMSTGMCLFAHIQCCHFTVSINMLTKLVTYYSGFWFHWFLFKIVLDVLVLPEFILFTFKTVYSLSSCHITSMEDGRLHTLSHIKP